MQGLDSLNSNLEGYYKRYYAGKLLTGTLLVVGILLSLALLFVLAEHFLHMGGLSRAILFFGFLITALGLVVLLILLPVAQWMGHGRKLSEADAARDIGKSIPEIEDRLLNALSLRAFAGEANALAGASVLQRAAELSHYQFSAAVDLRRSMTWIKFTLVPLTMVFLISLWNADIISQSTFRLVNYNQSFEVPPPFGFEFNRQALNVPEGQSFKLEVATVGSALPEHVFIEMEGTRFRMKSELNGQFTYTFNNVRNDIPFRLIAASVVSEDLMIEVLEQPKLIGNQAQLDYPTYTGLVDENLLNKTKLVVPEGTDIAWVFRMKDVQESSVLLNGTSNAAAESEDQLRIDATFRSSGILAVGMSSIAGLNDTTWVEVQVIKDAYPTLDVEMSVDSTSMVFYFSGKIGDDYGLTRFRFVAETEDGVVIDEEIGLRPSMREQAFVYAWPADSFLQGAGAALSYRLEIWDNDGINGPKMSTSRQWRYVAPTPEEIASENKKQFDDTKGALKEEEDRMKDLKKDLEDLRKDVLEKKEARWEDKEALKELLEERKQMMEKLQENAAEQQRQLEKSNKFNKYSEELLKKQALVQEMFEKLFDEEFKEKYEELEKLIEEFNKQQMLEKMDELELDNEKLEKELDRTLELFKQLEFEQGLEERIAELDKLKKDQDALKEETTAKDKTPEELSESQELLSERMEQLKDRLEELEDLNEALEDPNDMPSMEEPAGEAAQEMDEAKEQLDQKNEKKAGESQQKAGEKLEEMQESLSAFQQQMSQDQQTENLENMRQLLENIVDLSFNQEQVMEDLKPVKASDPRYVELSKRQKDIIDDTKIVEDSLLALSKRVPQIDKIVNVEMSEVKFNMQRALEELSNQLPNQEQRFKEMAADRQQRSMTALNNLALLFDAIIEQMQQEMSSSMKGSGQCQKPGQSSGGKPSASDMRKMQESLNKQLQQLKDAMEKGQNPNGKKLGESSGKGMGGMSKELARMAAEQAAIRQQLRELSQSLEQEGTGGSAGERMKELEKLMEQTEEDILYDRIDAQTLRRQQDILTKLLESEKAERERELEQKRESRSGLQNHALPPDLLENYEKMRQLELELYQTLPPNLKPFYRNEVNRYFSTLQD